MKDKELRGSNLIRNRRRMTTARTIPNEIGGESLPGASRLPGQPEEVKRPRGAKEKALTKIFVSAYPIVAHKDCGP